jgi:hypothetical protein
LTSLTGMDDQIELLDISRHLEAGELSPHTPPDTAATSPIRIQRSGVQPGGHEDTRSIAAECAYDTLDPGFIRLAQIKQDPLTGGVECRTERFSLQCPPPYTALSYACGPRPANFDFKLNGRDWKVRQNLSHFLRQRLHMERDSHEWLWIDAICINQANDSEQTHQVRLMAEIYGKASQVVVWLGIARGQSDDAMRGLLESNGDERALELVPWILAVEDLCSRAYWDRLWVLQELKLAKRKDLMCGSEVIPWQHFERFMLRFSEGSNEFSSYTLSRRISNIRSSAAMRMTTLTWTPTETSLLDLMDMSRRLQCEEARDRVYALFGLATREAASIDPNYEIDIPVFLNTVLKHHIERISDISILDVVSACKKLEGLFGTQPGTMFEMHSPTNQPPGRPGLIYRRLCTRAIDMPGLTLLWAIHHKHLRVQKLIKMALRTRNPYTVFGVLQVGVVIGSPFLFKSPDALLQGVFAIIGSILAINALAVSFLFWRRSEYRLSKLTVHAGRNGERRKKSVWSLCTALGHLSTWTHLWWVPFIVSECLVYIFAPVFRPLKRWFLILYFRSRGA